MEKNREVTEEVVNGLTDSEGIVETIELAEEQDSSLTIIHKESIEDNIASRARCMVSGCIKEHSDPCEFCRQSLLLVPDNLGCAYSTCIL